MEATAALQKSISYFFLQLGRIDLATVCDRAWEAMVAQANDLAEVAGGEKVGKLLAKASAKEWQPSRRVRSTTGVDGAWRNFWSLVGIYGGDWRELTLRQLCWAVQARQAHDWDMAATIVSAWTEIDFSKNPFRPRRKLSAGTYDTDALRREHKRLTEKARTNDDHSI